MGKYVIYIQLLIQDQIFYNRWTENIHENKFQLLFSFHLDVQVNNLNNKVMLHGKSIHFFVSRELNLTRHAWKKTIN